MNARLHSLAFTALLAVLAGLSNGSISPISAAPAGRPPSGSSGRGLAYAKTVKWDEVRRNPATVEVRNMAPGPFVEGAGMNEWAQVPTPFAAGRALVFTPTGASDGMAEFKVTAAGYLLVACNFDYQGKPGHWQKQRWTKTDFILDGWRELTLGDLGGPLVRNDRREQVVFIKKVAVGESNYFRCNKFDPPYFIVPL